MNYFRIKIGYNKNEYISIDETELEKAIYAFETDVKAKFKSGVVRGKDIIAITPDYHKALGYGNMEYEFNQEDWGIVNSKGLKKKLLSVYETISQKVDYLIQNKQEYLIGKNIKINTIENQKNKTFSNGVGLLVDKFKI